jgi:hypothetical protein
MTNPIKNHLFGTVLLLSSLQFGFAQSQSDLLTFVFGPPLLPVWDMSGTYQVTNRMQGPKFAPTLVVFHDLELVVDAKGKITGGTPTMVGYVGDDYIGGDYKVSGNVSGGGTKTQVKFTVKFKGNGIVAGVSSNFKINATYNLTVLPGTLQMGGKTTGNANFSSLGNGDLKSDATILPLPPGADGGWKALVQLVGFKNQLAGSAQVLVDSTPTNSAHILNTKVSGNWPKNSAVAKTKLSGTGNSTGTKVTLEFVPLYGQTNVAKVDGKVLGQKVKNY